jgi:L-lactate dehydrogenase complex protein LldE
MKVSLFVTCIVDQMFPQVGRAAVEVLRERGVEVVFNPDQTCCGQPAFNTGYRDEARTVALHMIDVFERELESADYVVAPSGSCTTMVRKFYAELFEGEPQTLSRVKEIGERIYELSEFLVDVLGIPDAAGGEVGAGVRGPAAASTHRRVTYHDCCHLLRELGVARQPRLLIQSVPGAELIEMDRSDACCGFGGTFSVKYPEISAAIGDEKIASIERSGADTVVACDSSCLMQIAGLAARRGLDVHCIHLAEFLCSRTVDVGE